LFAEDGAAMLEAVIILPVFVILAAGFFEFGALLYNKIKVETGLRDIARYVARCQDASYGCSAADATDIAVLGRLYRWEPGNVNVEFRYVANDDGSGNPIYNERDSDVDIVVVTTEFDYIGGPLLRIAGIPILRITAQHEERYIGW
jgi:hypothetical protein